MGSDEEAASGLRAARVQEATTELLLTGGENGHAVDGAPDGSGCSANSHVLVSTLVAACGTYAFGNAVGYSSPAESGIVDELGLSTAEYSVFGSALTIGAMCGAVLSGNIADLIGRRGAMWVSDIFCLVGWLAIIFAQSAWCLDLGRLFGGCGIGLISYVVPLYVAEITPRNVRGRFTSLSLLPIGIGKAITYLIGSVVNWRILAIIGTIPCLIQLIGLFFIPESPRWLAKVGREKEFEASLRRLRGNNADISQEASDILDYVEQLQSVSRRRIMELFQWKYAQSVTILVGLMIFQQFGGLNGFVFYASSIFEAGGPVTGVVLMDKMGRRPLLLTSAAGTCLGCFLTGLSFFLQDLNSAKDLVSGLVLLGVLVFLGSFELGMGGIPWIIMSEILPINIKGSAGSLVSLVSWMGSWAVSYTYNFQFAWSSAGTFFIYAVICGAGVVFIGKVVPETKGRTLEEIQASITS